MKTLAEILLVETSLLSQVATVLKHVVSKDFILCRGPVLYFAKNEEIHAIVPYHDDVMLHYF